MADDVAGQAAGSDERPPVWTGHLVLTSRDPERAANFYEKLGFRTVAVMEGLGVMELRGGTHLVIRGDPAADAGPAGFDLMVEDLDATREAWSAMGVEVTAIGKDERGIHRSFTVTDADGHTLTVNDSHVVGPV
jgi:catechol 2,3-dioxygenase-like lactoylglutathione lyase family enzyme